MATFKDADPNTPGIQIKTIKGPDGSNILQGNIEKSVNQSAFSDPKGFMKGIRSKGLPINGAIPPEKKSATATLVSSPELKDWRVKLSLPKQFEKSPMLSPLVNTGGLIFPYTPTMILQHSANYNPISPIHNNFSYFAYQNSSIDQIVITGQFFQQNEIEAQYYLATMHYLRSVTKMFYGDDANSGNPPPVVKLNGYGDYVFKNVPVIVQSFQMDMPADVDYIACSVLDAPTVRANVAQRVPTGAGGISYVPTESQVTVTVQPIYSRSQVEQFSLTNFVNGKYVIDGKGYV